MNINTLIKDIKKEFEEFVGIYFGKRFVGCMKNEVMSLWSAKDIEAFLEESIKKVWNEARKYCKTCKNKIELRSDEKKMLDM